MRISDWSSDVCSSDLTPDQEGRQKRRARRSRPPAHDPRLRRLEREHEAERDGENQVDPENLYRRHRHGEAEKNGGDDGQRLAALGRKGPGDEERKRVGEGKRVAGSVDVGGGGKNK